MTRADGSFASIRWSWIASAAVLLAIVSIAIAVVVLSLHGSDALASIALALAILSFVTQFIVYIVQTQNAASQLRASQETNLRTQSTLTEIVQKTSNVETAVGGQMQKMIDWFLSNQLPAAAKEVEAKTGADAATIERLLDSRLRPILDTFDGGVLASVDPARVAEDRRVLRRLATGLIRNPIEEVRSIADSLGIGDRVALMRFLVDERQSREQHQLIGLPEGTPGLESAHLIAQIQDATLPPTERSPWRRLTALGIDVALYGERHGWLDLIGNRVPPAEELDRDEPLDPRALDELD